MPTYNELAELFVEHGWAAHDFISDEFEAAIKKRLTPFVGRVITPVLTDEIVDIVAAALARDNRWLPVWFSPSPEHWTAEAKQDKRLDKIRRRQRKRLTKSKG
jgi:hypothetical protein